MSTQMDRSRSPLTSSSRLALCLLLLSGASLLRAQTNISSVTPRVDVGVTYIAEVSLKAGTTNNFTLQGGSAELGFNFAHGFGIAGVYSDAHANSIGNSNVPLTLAFVGVGPRYRWHADRRISAYAEGLVGVATGSDSLFPVNNSLVSSASSYGQQIGGGIDYRVTNAFAIRALDVAYLRTTLPNATNGEQNTLRIGAGLVLRFGH